MKLNRPYSNAAADVLSEFDHLFNRAFSRSFIPGATRSGESFSVFEADDAWRLRTDLPGFQKDDVNLRLQDGVLHLTAEVAEKGGDQDYAAFRSNVARSFRLPDNIDVSAIGARLENGVLEITLPKAEIENPEPLQIEVK